MTVIADTGALYALADRSDRWHESVSEWWSASRPSIIVPVTVLPEVTYLIASRLGAQAEIAFVRSVVEGELPTEPLEPEDIARAVALMNKYADLPLGFVDATVVAIAERLETRDVLTTDRRHFAVIKPANGKRLLLHP